MIPEDSNYKERERKKRFEANEQSKHYVLMKATVFRLADLFSEFTTILIDSE